MRTTVILETREDKIAHIRGLLELWRRVRWIPGVRHMVSLAAEREAWDLMSMRIPVGADGDSARRAIEFGLDVRHEGRRLTFRARLEEWLDSEG